MTESEQRKKTKQNKLVSPSGSLVLHFKANFLAEFDRAKRTATVSSSFCIAFSLSRLTSPARFPAIII